MEDIEIIKRPRLRSPYLICAWPGMGEVAFKAAQEIAGMPWGIVRATDDLLDDEHFRERGFFLEVEHPELGETFTYPGAGAVFSASPQRIYRRAPLIGEDNATVYASIGVDAARLAQLRAAGVV